jgi:hypothetical protein
MVQRRWTLEMFPQFEVPPARRPPLWFQCSQIVTLLVTRCPTGIERPKPLRLIASISPSVVLRSFDHIVMRIAIRLVEV